ncbi:hypothetical protein HWV62_20732 [Athelia sp. TMB]|nr:hypothetical protein HWV62_20732 [Athelia sp. TMB]
MAIQIVVTGGQILGKAFYEAGRQAVKNAKAAPASAVGSDVAGVRHATTGSPTDKLTREHRMTLDEAHLILNTKPDSTIESIKNHYEHLFKMNSPAPKAPKAKEATPKPKPTGKAAKAVVVPTNSHYLQSKVVRALERIEAELKIAKEDGEVVSKAEGAAAEEAVAEAEAGSEKKP